MKIGVMLPSFERSTEPALAFAEEVESVGLHGLFCYDHLWPMGHPGLPSLSPFPLLAAISSVTSSVHLGTLVARVGLEPDEVTVASFRSLAELGDGRVIAAIGTGDVKSRQENLAFGLEVELADRRREHLEQVASDLRAAGLETWIGGGAPATNAIAHRLGCTVNLWAGGEDALARMASEVSVSWGGQLPTSPQAGARKLLALQAAGASWAVLSWQGPLAPLLETIELARIPLR